MQAISEMQRLAGIASDSWYAQGANGWTTAYSFEVFQRFITAGPILELGPAEGVMTDSLASLGLPLTVVEGSEVFCRDIQRRHPAAKVHHSLFEDFEPTEQFQNIILGHVLEHVEDPVRLLTSARQWLLPRGRVICAVPNSRSLHRQVGVMMGLLDFEEALNEADHHHGHRRVYNPETFRRDFLQAGYEIDYFGGYFMKPLSNSQIESSFTPEMVRTFMKLGERYPDIAAELVIVASAKTGADA
ncbi:MAG: class I SAM-dependent methyltransferase [Sphingomicrobium sp.]